MQTHGVSTATQTALDLKAPMAAPALTGTVAGVTTAMVGLTDVELTASARSTNCSFYSYSNSIRP